MTWLRVGDQATSHPIFLRGGSVDGADSRTRLELWGFAVALASMSGAHDTDYVVERGHIDALAPFDGDRLLGQALEAGYLSPLEVDGRRVFRIVDEHPDLIHLRLRAEVEWDRRRKRDNGNVDMTLEVQRRDGSVCRWCGRTVNWSDKAGTRGATYDHLRKPARGPADMVVACKGCNAARGEPGSPQAAAFEADRPLRPAPAEPHYCQHVRARLAKHGITVPSGGSAENALEARPSDQLGNGDRPAPQAGNGPSVDRPAKPSARPQRGDGNGTVKPGRGPKVNSPGTGRDGPSRDGPSRDGAGGAKRRRPRRRRR